MNKVKNALELALGVFREPYCDAPLDDVIKACEEALASLTCEMGEMCLQCPDAQPTPVPKGWKLVPMNATHEIENAIGKARNLKASEIWEDALAASPAAQPAKQEQGEPAFYGFMDKNDCCVHICHTPWAAGGPNNELPTAYYTTPQPKQEQGEPVAVVTGVYGGRFTYAPFKASVILPVGMAFYSSPQQRKPLTNKQLFEHWQVAKVSDMTHAEIDIADYVLIARDVEALHNIKE